MKEKCIFSACACRRFQDRPRGDGDGHVVAAAPELRERAVPGARLAHGVVDGVHGAVRDCLPPVNLLRFMVLVSFPVFFLPMMERF